MPWEKTEVRYWTVCWKWIFPYPCRKTKTKYCCSGMLKVRCYGFFGERWFCCDSREHHWWSFCFGIGTRINQDRICKNSIPDESEDCPNIVDVIVPGTPGTSRSAQSYLLRQASITGGIGATIGGVIGAIAIGGTQQIVAGAIIGLIFGTGLGVGRRGGCMITLIAILIAVLLFLLRFF